MPSRRPHRKSRNGCVECKRRRVKCNEQHPCCNCLKYDIVCTYGLESIQRQDNPVQQLLSETAQTASIVGDPSCTGSPYNSPGPVFGFQDLELMHHFSTSTYKLLSSSNGIRDVWGIALPKEAYSCDYLMHGLLALSALHLDSLNQGQSNYESLSTYHFHKCLTRFIDGLAHISTENCVSLFGLSSLIVVHVCGQSVRDVCPPSSRGNSASAIEKVLGIFNMCRGVETILAPYWAQIQQSSLGSLLHEDYRLIGSRPSSFNSSQDFSEGPPFSGLKELIKSQDNSSEEENTYLDALTKLEMALGFIQIAKHPLEPGAAFIWPIMMQRDFLRILTQRTPISLVLLSYYCVILDCLDDYWFLHDWGKALFTEIERTLPSQLQPWILWPKRICGLDNCE